LCPSLGSPTKAVEEQSFPPEDKTYLFFFSKKEEEKINGKNNVPRRLRKRRRKGKTHQPHYLQEMPIESDKKKARLGYLFNLTIL
jgi:hypothetical protein